MLELPPSDAPPGRRIGVEIEFSGLDEDRIAALVADHLGGQISRPGLYERKVSDTRLGDIRIELDTSYKSQIASAPDLVGSIAHRLVPAEIITGPLPEDRLKELDELAQMLRKAGAEGTRTSLVNGFGVHFNPEQEDRSVAAILPVMQSWAVLEPWLRQREPMSMARRALPFTAPWPEALRAELLSFDAGSTSMDRLIDAYLDHAPSRNFGLDVLPLLREIDAPRILARLGDEAPGARPTWHFRLPSCRIDEEGWTVTGEWEKWLTVEALAAMPRLLERTGRDWMMNFRGRPFSENAWVERLDRTLRDH
ncbi:amidoligase family protein [Mangrovicoccus algicola]|uniref:Amidoligase family protein n=1 Tax=Mangrovicoccus algicola TaxID=2771008 RepID=A0A8J7CHN3_9RHOB|nr:amidoligase family protein [Mangrovicoccus algicola]MBE3638415.1 amidoligase family protein [Mangrovicoccus algicola]